MRRVLAAVLVGMVLTACTTSEVEPTRAPLPTAAYLTPNELVLVLDTEVVYRASGSFAPGGPGVQFTGLDRFAFAVGRDGILTIDMYNRTHHTIDCGGCDHAVPLDDSRIAWIDVAGTIVSVDSATPGPAAPYRVPVAGVDSFEVPVPAEPGVAPPRLVGRLPEFFVVIEDLPAGGSVSTITWDAAIHRIETDEIDRAASLGPNGVLAVATHRPTDTCASSGNVVLVHAASGVVVDTGLDRVPTGPDMAVRVHDLWRVQSDQVLAAIVSIVSCDPAAGAGRGPTLWRYDGQRWTQDGSTPVLSVRDSPWSPDTRYVISPEGALSQDHAGTDISIAADVLAVEPVPLIFRD